MIGVSLYLFKGSTLRKRSVALPRVDFSGAPDPSWPIPGYQQARRGSIEPGALQLPIARESSPTCGRNSKILSGTGSSLMLRQHQSAAPFFEHQALRRRLCSRRSHAINSSISLDCSRPQRRSRTMLRSTKTSLRSIDCWLKRFGYRRRTRWFSLSRSSTVGRRSLPLTARQSSSAFAITRRHASC